MTQGHDPYLDEALRSALETSHGTTMASADWLARDVDPRCASAVALLADPTTTLEHLRQAKSAFKTLRIVGESATDRRVGARLYLAAIAAGLAHHDCRITTQSDAAIIRGLERSTTDDEMPETLRDLCARALARLRDGRPASPA